MIVVKCVLRGRPQGGRAVFIVNLLVVELDLQLSSLATMAILDTLLQFRKLDVGFGRQIRILTPSRVELIGKRSIFGLETTPNR
eukprot:scaffold19827_cov171-Skeletonema_dohrnii-CCMP3373.AAC.1